MSNSETETIQPQRRPTIERRYWMSGLLRLGKRQTADLARERSWKAACFAPCWTDGDQTRPSLSRAAVVGRLSPTPMLPEPEFHYPFPSCSVARRIATES
jgi:hypothetical protein